MEKDEFMKVYSVFKKANYEDRQLMLVILQQIDEALRQKEYNLFIEKFGLVNTLG